MAASFFPYSSWVEDPYNPIPTHIYTHTYTYLFKQVNEGEYEEEYEDEQDYGHDEKQVDGKNISQKLYKKGPG